MHSYFSSCRSSYLLVLLILTQFFFATGSQAQNSEPDSLTFYWHKAFFSEINKDNNEVIVCYDKVLSLCETLPIDIREWFKGTCFFGIARAKANLQDKDGTRDALTKAFSRHFWNFSLIQSLDIFNSLCGKQWIDSECLYWSRVREKEIQYWHVQPTLLLKPTYLQPSRKYPVIIVLHGGNDCYERFVMRLHALADTLGVITVFPAGVHRISEVTNSWDGDTTAAEAKLDALIRELVKDPTVDTTNISLFGYSQGSQVAYDYGFSHPGQIRNVVAFSGFAPAIVQEAELKNAAAHKMKFIAISGSSDSPEFLRSSRQLQHDAQQQGLSFAMRIEPDLPHGLPMDIIGYFTNIWRQLNNNEAFNNQSPMLATPDSLQHSQKGNSSH